MGTLLTLSAFGGIPIAGSITNPESWFEWSERFGFPLVALGLVVLLGLWATRAVWKFSKPLIEKLVNGALALIEKQSEFVDVVSAHQSELKALVETGHGGHQKTHEKLGAVSDKIDALSGVVKEIHGEIVK